MAYIWHNGAIVDETEAPISVRTHALHYGSSVFEGIRFYDVSGRAAIFRLDEHLDRLLYSARAMRMPLSYGKEDLRAGTIATVHANGSTSGYIRPFIFYGTRSLGLDVSDVPVETMILVLPWGAYLPPAGISLKTTSLRRIQRSAHVPEAKIGGAYMNSVMAHQEAREHGYDEALLLDAEGMIAEGSGENIFFVKDGALITPPHGNILPGITRDALMILAHDHGYPVVERSLQYEEIHEMDECFLVGTAAEITPVLTLDDVSYGTAAGSVTAALQELFSSVTNNTHPRSSAWLTFGE